MYRIILENSESNHRVTLPDGGEAVLNWRSSGEELTLKITLPYDGVYGLGEKFDGMNQKGKHPVNRVEEKFCYQGEKTYCPAPFFFTDTGFGMYIETYREIQFEFQETICCRMEAGAKAVIFTGEPRQIIAEYMAVTGPAVLPPAYAFGPWISANHWNSEKDVLEQLELLKQYEFPATVLVLEAWSDEATFYTFFGAQCKAQLEELGEEPGYEDYDFSGSSRFEDPEKMIQRMGEEGLHLVLWQIPVYKKQGPGEPVSERLLKDREEALRRGLCVMNQDGTPYEIPEGNWFAGSWIPDFTNPETVKSWFGKRQYLLDIGVAGFKTDGGEFIYRGDVVFADGTTGREGRNKYAADYLKAYADFAGPERVLFSRAGYVGTHMTPMHWAGDHQSVQAEFKSVLSAGLSASLSGTIFWGFDIGGFGGELPSLDLYKRSTEMACFCPVMQWHSEPDGGQFKEQMEGGTGNNERSPWNLAKAHHCPEFTGQMRYWHWLRMNLLPYIISSAMRCVKENMPLMRPLLYGWPDDKRAVATDDEYCFGDSLLVAPLMEENSTSREVWLPEGGWYDFFSREYVTGGRDVTSSGGHIAVYIREGCGVGLWKEEGRELGSTMKGIKEGPCRLHFILTGETGSHNHNSDKGITQIAWRGLDVTVTGALEGSISWEIWRQ